MKKLISVLGVVLLSGGLYAQSLKQRTADRLYSELSYLDAADYYKDLVNTKLPAEDNLRRLADCYFKLYDFQHAEQTYRELMAAFPQHVTENDRINYMQALKYNARYDAVKQVLGDLESNKQATIITKNHRAQENYYKDLKADSGAYHITNVDMLNTSAAEFSPILFRKGTGLMFASNRRNTGSRNKTFAWDDSYFIDMYDTRRTDTLHFQNLQSMSKTVSSLYHDGPSSLSPDERTLYLTRSNVLVKQVKGKSVSVINLKLYILTKDSTGRLGEAVSFPYNSDEYSLGHAALTADGKRMYFVSDMPGGYGQTDLYYSDLVNSQWQKPVNLGPAINSEGREMFPYVYEDGTLFFSSDGRAGLGGLDIYFAVPSVDLYFEPQSLSYPINTNADDFGFWLNEDMKTGYFSSNRQGGKGKDDIYYFRSREALLGSTLSGIVFDENTKDTLPGSRVYLLNEHKQVVDSAIADARGGYSFRIKNPRDTYYLGGKNPGKYYDRLISAGELKTGDNRKDIGLYPKYKLICTVTDKQSGAPVEGCKVTVIDHQNGAQKTYTTNPEGVFTDVLRNKKAGDQLDLSFKFEKEGYITVERNVSIPLDENTIVELQQQIQKLELGADIAKVIQINPIYFDLAKWNIRPDAAKELDKIVKVMKENPTMVIELGSHTDCRSSAAYNMSLSDKRAKSSAAYIISKGIAKDRIYGKGYGESKLINKCECEGKKVTPCTEEEHQANRRTEFIIIRF